MYFKIDSFFLRSGAITLIFAGSLLGLSACVPKPANQSAPALTTTPVNSQNDLKPDPALVTGVLDNGLRYAVLRNQTPPGTGALRVQFQTGSLNELPGTEGLAHYLEHMAFNGSKNVPEGEMIKILERLGLSFGADTNATTSLDKTVYKLNLPTLETEVLEAAFMLMRETAQNLTLDQGAIERELGIILSEKRTRDSAEYRAWEARMNFLTNGSDLMERLPIGSQKSLGSIKADDFKAYYAAHYHPEKTMVVFVGDYEPQAIVRYIKETFGDWEPATEAQEDRPPSAADIPKNQIEFYAEEGLSTNISLMALRPYEKKIDNLARRNQRIIENFATRMMAYRMQELTASVDRPFINASMSRMSTFELTEGAAFSAYTQADNWETALTGLDTELRRVLKYGFTQLELDAQLARVQNAYEAMAKGADTRPTNALIGGLIDQLLSSFDKDTVFIHPQHSLEIFMALKGAITVERVNTVLREMWGNIDDVNVFMSTDTIVENAQLAIRNVLNESRQIAVPAPLVDSDVATEFAYTSFGDAGEIVSDIYNEKLDAHLIKFKNNVRLNFKRTEFEKDRVLVVVNFGGGNMSTPRKNEGLRRMAYGVVTQSGLEKHTIAEMKRLMAGKLVTTYGFNFRVGGDTFYLSGKTVPDDLRDQLNVFAARLTQSAFRPEVRTNHIDKMKAWYPRHDTTIDGVVSEKIPRIIRSGDERFGFGKEEDFYNTTMGEIEDWIRPQFETGLVEITIIGEVDKDTVVKHVAQTFGALSERMDKKKNYPDMRSITFPEGSSDPYKVYHRGDDNQAQLRIYWPASDGFDVQYSRRLSVLASILRNRLVKEIREGEATTYSPQAAAHASRVFPDYGYLAAVLTIKPEDVANMASKVQAIANDMAANPITEDEFVRAITPILDRLESSDKRNAYWYAVLSDAQTDGMGLKRHMTLKTDFANMKVADIQALAKDVFREENSIEIHVLPTT